MLVTHASLNFKQTRYQRLMRKLSFLKKLGEGASGVVWSAGYDSDSGSAKKVAVKIFKGTMTSDGQPTDEMKIF